MATLKELLQQEREFEEKQPISYFIKEIEETLSYAKDDGFDLKELSKAVQDFKNNYRELDNAYNIYYNDDNMIKDEFKPICGYLNCIGQYIRAIKKKLS